MALACHNCRRGRLKCDRSLPQCLKCIKRGRACLGYQRLFRWEQGIASRGNMAGMTFEKLAKQRDSVTHINSSPQLLSPVYLSNKQLHGYTEAIPLHWSLTDSLVQDMNHSSRKYLFYFASHVCRDLVLYDAPNHNPFRELIPLTRQYPVLLQIIIANSALHMSNACQRSLVSDTLDFPLRHRKISLGSSCSGLYNIQRPEAYNDALAAKQRALYFLISSLTKIDRVDIDVTLAVVLLFIEFQLIDSGRDDWRPHVEGARTIIKTLCESNTSTSTAMSSLRRCLISNCLIFDILGSTLACSTDLMHNNTISNSSLSLLQDAEGNHCSSFPAIFLQLIQSASQLYQSNHMSSSPHPLPLSTKQQEQAFLLLQTAQSFDPLAWATALQPRSPTTDLVLRTHIAAAHRAAMCIYLSRVLFSLFPNTSLSNDLESLVADVIFHLSFIRPSDALFTATTWPAFIAGAETCDCASRKWVKYRFEELWMVEPWGLMRGALGVLERTWAGRMRTVVVDEDGSVLTQEMGGGDWMRELRETGVDWLIL